MYLSLGRNLVTTLSRQLPCQSLRGRMSALEADKGYDAAWLRQTLLNAGILPVIPYQKIKSREAPDFKEACSFFRLTSQRWKVERAFAWLKRRCRRLLLRWERLAVTWHRFSLLGVIYTWLRNLFG